MTSSSTTLRKQQSLKKQLGWLPNEPYTEPMVSTDKDGESNKKFPNIDSEDLSTVQFCEVLRSHPKATIEVTDVNVTEQVKKHWVLMWKTLSSPIIPLIVPQLETTSKSAVSNKHLRKRVHAKQCLTIGNAQARMAFFKRNLPALPIEKFSVYGGGENAKKGFVWWSDWSGIS
ncbi:hypothetical protein IV203_002320 [Nitzschia inconspicua]|uniref:Uncharacterized protein n=1 Tax=Nitzschia inconspicua TaxID=303405 RepID=A0A9K3L8V4_9STRA|nr:hypothetical protein IV203_002320 [Nitzschia inconspicua]